MPIQFHLLQHIPILLQSAIYISYLFSQTTTDSMFQLHNES